MVIINWSQLHSKSTEFSIDSDDLSNLEIRDARNGTGFYYFYDTASNRLITDFVLNDRPRVALMCSITIVRKEDRYSPRLRFWKKDKTKPGKEVTELPIPSLPGTRQIKALVDTEDGHQNFWKLIDYLQSLVNLDLPRNSFRIVDGESAGLAVLLAGQNKADLLQAVRKALGGSLSDEDITLLANRKVEVERFERLLKDPSYFDETRSRLSKSPEGLWQQFFEDNSWIFGYGLSLVTHESLVAGKLERITTGANVFDGGGKRIDAIMRTRAVISSLLFCEIKRHDTALLERVPYRRPDVFQPSKELTGGTAQLQKTTRKAIRSMTSQIHTLTADDGSPTDIDFSTTLPRQVLLVGSLDQFRSERGINGEMIESFELYRKSLVGIDVVTFDELYERARFIVGA